MSKTTGHSNIDKAITTSAANYGVDPNLVYSIMYNESSFRSDVVNKGHYGLMQLSKVLLNENGLKDWENAALNTDVGTKYLSYLIRLFDGDKIKAIAAYNCGEGKVLKLIKKHGNNWKDNLPKETKTYLGKVTKMYNLL